MQVSKFNTRRLYLFTHTRIWGRILADQRRMWSAIVRHGVLNNPPSQSHYGGYATFLLRTRYDLMLSDGGLAADWRRTSGNRSRKTTVTLRWLASLGGRTTANPPRGAALLPRSVVETSECRSTTAAGQGAMRRFAHAMTALLQHACYVELHWLAEQVRIETDQRNFGGLAVTSCSTKWPPWSGGSRRTNTDYGGSRRSHWGLPTQWAALWRFTYGSWRNMADQRPYSCAALPPPRSVYVWLQLYCWRQCHTKPL